MTKPKSKDDLSEYGPPQAAQPPKPHPRPHVPHPTPKKPETKPRETKPVPRPDKPTRSPKATAVAVVPLRPLREDVALAAAIANAATNPNTNVAVMRELRDTLREAREQLARNAASRDFLALQRVLPEVKKDGTIDMGTTTRGAQGVKSRYVKFESMHKAVMPLVGEYNFTISFEGALRGPTDNVTEIVVGILEHTADSNGQYDAIPYRRTERILTPDTTGAKNAQQAKAAGMSYLKRYMTIDLLNIRSLMDEAADLDGNDLAKIAAAEAAKKPISTKDLARLRAAIADCGVTDQAVLDKYKIARLEDMTVGTLPDALKACANFKAARNDS